MKETKTYTVYWRRNIEPEKLMSCGFLTKNDIIRRIIGAIKNTGPVTIEKIERDKD